MRRAELEKEVSRPDLWDDPDQARRRDLGVQLGQRRHRAARGPRRHSVRRRGALRAHGRGVRRLRHRRAHRAVDDLRAPDVGARAALAVRRRVRRARRHRRAARRCRGHRRPGLVRDAAADVPAVGGTPGFRLRGRRGHRGSGGRAAVGHLHREGAVRLRAAVRRARRAPPGAHVTVRLPAPAPDELRLGSTSSRSSRTPPPRSTSTRRTCASTPTGPRGPVASTSTRPTRRCASPTCRPGSWCRARTSAASTRTRRGPCRSWPPSSPSASAPSGGPSSTTLSGPQGRRGLGEPDPLVRDGAVPDGEGPPHGVRDGQRRRRARR